MHLSTVTVCVCWCLFSCFWYMMIIYPYTYMYIPILTTSLSSDTLHIFAGYLKRFNCGWILPIVGFRVHNKDTQLRICTFEVQLSISVYQWLLRTFAECIYDSRMIRQYLKHHASMINTFKILFTSKIVNICTTVHRAITCQVGSPAQRHPCIGVSVGITKTI